MSKAALIVTALVLYVVSLVAFARIINGPFRPAQRAPRKPQTQPVKSR